MPKVTRYRVKCGDIYPIGSQWRATNYQACVDRETVLGVLAEQMAEKWIEAIEASPLWPDNASPTELEWMLRCEADQLDPSACWSYARHFLGLNTEIVTDQFER